MPKGKNNRAAYFTDELAAIQKLHEILSGFNTPTQFRILNYVSGMLTSEGIAGTNRETQTDAANIAEKLRQSTLQQMQPIQKLVPRYQNAELSGQVGQAAGDAALGNIIGE